ncbi:MAG: hypothetical protein J6X05_03695 [Bacteroidales bacterium]|nr:hypothetical protein [Bacteroidales bacterium]
MKRIAIFVAMVALIVACNPYGSEIPRDLVDNYLDINTGEWKLGLYEEFAIYQNDFWDYKSVADNQIVLVKKTGETTTLNLKSFDEWGRGTTFSMFVNGTQLCKHKTPRAIYDSQTSMYQLDFLMKHWRDSLPTFKKHEYRIDTAVVRLYLRNTAQGASAFGKRSVNRRKDIQVLNYLESKNVIAYPIDSTDHYGYRYEFKIPVTGVSEIPMANLFNYRNMGWNSEAGKVMNYVVEPGDTLMFFGWEDGLGFSSVNAYGNVESSGGDNWVFNTEKQLLVWDDNPNEYKEITDNMYGSRLYKDTYLTKRHFKDLNYLLSCDPNSDSLKAVFPISEDEIFKTVTVYDFVINYIKQHADTLPSTPENLAQHPDWIVAEASNNEPTEVIRRTVTTNDGKEIHEVVSSSPITEVRKANYLINPEFIKKLGLSDDFIEFYRLMQAVQFYDDFSPVTPMQDFEKQSIMRNITKADYKRYLEDKMRWVKE